VRDERRGPGVGLSVAGRRAAVAGIVGLRGRRRTGGGGHPDQEWSGGGRETTTARAGAPRGRPLRTRPRGARAAGRPAGDPRRPGVAAAGIPVVSRKACVRPAEWRRTAGAVGGRSGLAGRRRGTFVRRRGHAGVDVVRANTRRPISPQVWPTGTWRWSRVGRSASTVSPTVPPSRRRG